MIAHIATCHAGSAQNQSVIGLFVRIEACGTRRENAMELL
jgi:hypothetical protein